MPLFNENKLINCICLVLATLTSVLFSTSTRADTTKDLTLLVGQAMPPYICPDNEQGLELELVRMALAIEGYRVIPKRMPLARIPRALNAAQADGALTLSPDLPLEHVYLSDSHISYQNAFFSLDKFDIKLNSINDIKGKSLVAFQNAQHYLGDHFSDLVKDNQLYQEHHNQAKQVSMLLKERTQLVVMDKHIFQYYYNKSPQEAMSQKIRSHDLLPVNQYHVGFLRDSWRDAFNRGLKKLKQRGIYKQITSKYLDCAQLYVKSVPDKPPQAAECPC